MKLSTRLKRIIIISAGCLGLLYLLLLIPDGNPDIPSETVAQPFIWDKDAYWQELETLFIQTRENGFDTLINEQLQQLAIYDLELSDTTLLPENPIFDSLEILLFSTGAKIAACPDNFQDFFDLYNKLRKSVKQLSRHWDMNHPETRNRLYRLLYGGRMVIEEIILQQKDSLPPPIFYDAAIYSATPAINEMGVTIHSGDILVSRGGAPTSALIARGSDYPGNFSHIALAHVDESTGMLSVIESHIEIGVAIADWKKYIDDKKLRIMLLRPNEYILNDIDSLLPHKAATLALNRAHSEHIPYDFSMDFEQDDKLFCSEVASAVYKKLGVTLWMGRSTISQTGLRYWLSDFGVEHFVTQEPSDLEYDPQLSVVAEWRNPETLQQDHLDNAVIDVMLEHADAIGHLKYNHWLLPAVRFMKGYSLVLNLFGKAGPIPEGMSATSALKNEWFSSTHHEIRSKLILSAEKFVSNNGYYPPYWVLITLAEQAYNDCEIK